MVYFETETIELKERITDSLPKEIVSFLNSYGGTIYIGIKNNGEIVGVTNMDSIFRMISDVITDQIEPIPYNLIEQNVIYENNLPVIKLNIKKGLKNLYCVKRHGFSPSGCYIRIGTTCKSLTEEEIQKRYFKSLANQDLMLQSFGTMSELSFNTLKNYYTEAGYHLDDESFELNFKFRTSEGHYNKLAELLADHNMVPIIVVKFDGYYKTSISHRNDYGGGCLLFTYEKIKNRFISENICRSDTTIRPRKDTYLFDINAANEAIVNALVHNDWTISQPLFSFFKDRIEILSHGGLPNGESIEDFFKGVSRPRNDMLMTIFNQMTISEHTGHGVPIIVKTYGKEAFEITGSYIKVTIPFNPEVIPKNMNSPNKLDNSTKTNNLIVAQLLENPYLTVEELSKRINVSKRTIDRCLSSLKEEGTIIRKGNTRGCWIVQKNN